jgi:hypothetical protein
VDVHAGMHVVDQVPTGVIWVLIHHKIVAAGPAPVRGLMPVPVSDFKEEPAWEPEAVMVWVNPKRAVAVGGTEALEASVLEWMVDMEALVVRSLMPVPVIVSDMRDLVQVPACVTLHFPLGVWFLARLGSLRNSAIVCAGRIGVLRSASVRAAAMLCICGESHNRRQCENKSQSFFHGYAPPS